MSSLMIVAALVVLQPPPVPGPPDVPGISIAPLPPPSFDGERPAMTYTIASKLAAESGRPLVVFVTGSPRQVPGTLVCQTSSLAGVYGPAVVVALPDRQGWLTWKATLPANASEEEIRVAAGLIQPGGLPIGVTPWMVPSRTN